jgi:hypothetical protein
MAKIIALALLAAALVVAGSGWALVTTDHWPLSDRAQPATAIYAANRSAANWLLEHGERVNDATMAAAAAAPGAAYEPLTADEIAKAEQAMRSDPRVRDRIVLNPMAAKVIPKPARG